MPSSFQAVAAFIVALVPGALYFWSYERIAGRWGANLTDRLFRFVGASALFHAILAPATYRFWTEQWPRVVAGDRLTWWLWGAVLLYVSVPMAAGTIVGFGTRGRKKWATFATGPDPAPRAWDHLFHGKRDGWIRLKLKSGTWVGGAYATSDEDNLMSYSAGYPEGQDLFLASTIDVDPETGEFVRDAAGNPSVAPRSGLLVRWEEVEYLQFIRIDVLPAAPDPQPQTVQAAADDDHDEGNGDDTTTQHSTPSGE